MDPTVSAASFSNQPCRSMLAPGLRAATPPPTDARSHGRWRLGPLGPLPSQLPLHRRPTTLACRPVLHHVQAAQPPGDSADRTASRRLGAGEPAPGDCCPADPRRCRRWSGHGSGGESTGVLRRSPAGSRRVVRRRRPAKLCVVTPASISVSTGSGVRATGAAGTGSGQPRSV